VRSAEFARLWAKAEVKDKTSDTFQLRHPLVGDLDLVFESLRPNGSPDVVLKIYRAEPGSATAEALAVLGSLTADQQAPDRAAIHTTTRGFSGDRP
jgi:hypothetical protein